MSPKSALKNKIKNTFVSVDIILISASWNATELMPIIIRIIALGVFSLKCIIYNWKKIFKICL